MKSKEVRTLIVYVNIEDELIKNLLTAHGREVIGSDKSVDYLFAQSS